MSALERFSSALNRFSLKTLLACSLGMVALFCALVVAYVRVSEGTTVRMMDELITVDGVLSELCLKSTTAMINARRLEKDFLLNYREFGFEESRSRYLTRVVTSVAEIKANMARIRLMAADPESARQTREVESALERYLQGIEAMADLIGKRGYHESGVHGALEAALRDSRRLAEGIGSDKLIARLLAVMVAEEEFVESSSDSDAHGFGQAYGGFIAAVSAVPLPAGVRAELAKAADRYRALFEDYVRLTEEIRVVKNGYLRSVQTIDPMLEKLHVGALARIAAKQRAIERNTRLLSLPVITAGAVVLTLLAAFSLAMALAVTRSVMESKSFAERIASGDLGSRLVPAGKNEFHALATALNSMAESLFEAELAREKSIEVLRESEQKYRSFVETSTDWIWAIDREGRHTYSNERVRAFLGIEPQELLQAGAFELFHPEDVARVRELLGAGLSTGLGWRGVVLRWRHRDGTWRWIESNAVAVTDALGAVVGFRGVDRDVTERRRLEEELVKTQKLEAIGTLAGGIAHDFNNLLQGLFGYISLAKLNLGRKEKAGELLDQAEKALNLSVNLTTQLLTFAKGGKPVKKIISLPELLEDAAKFALSGSRSDYRLVVDRDLWSVEADDGQLSQVIQNLVLNGSEAMTQGGTVEIAAGNEVVAEGGNPLVPAGGNFVRIDVRDSGAGISGQHLARVFDPYFTTKQKGSGLGLATSYSIVRSHGGFIDVTSRPGEGSVFTVYLPASPGVASREPHGTAAAGRVSGKVLLMDDDDLVRDVAAKMIASLGHAVATAANGEDALTLYCDAREEGRPFDVVVLDLTVKRGMGGEEAIRRLREIDPAVKAVVSSGYADATVLAEHLAHGFSACLNKPYRLDALRDCLSALLETRATAAEVESRS